MKSNAETVDEYLDELPADQREAIEAVREVVLKSLPEGYEETMQYGMIGYVIPLSRYPVTYNKQPLGYAALSSEKNYISLHMWNIYGDQETERWFTKEYEASGKKLNMGKSCVRFKAVDDLPLDLIGQSIRLTPVDEFIERYEAARQATANRKRSN